jgi:hypothetical protein
MSIQLKFNFEPVWIDLFESYRIVRLFGIIAYGNNA